LKNVYEKWKRALPNYKLQQKNLKQQGLYV
jgi:hypothetical protein